MLRCTLHASLAVALALAPTLASCSKPESVPTPEPGIISITATPPAPASAPLASASVDASAPALASASASASATARPSAAPRASAPSSLAAIASAAPQPARAPAPAAPLEPAATRLSGKNFTLDVASPGCRVDVPCVVTLRLTALGDYHVNKEYPYKLTAAAAAGVQFLGSADANVFSRAAGDFREEGEKTATMTVRFKPTAAGEARVSGTYKMSVCSAESCQIESQPVSLVVPVK